MNRRIFRCLAASFAAIAAGAFAEAPQSDTSPTAADLTSMFSAKAAASSDGLFGNYKPAFLYVAEDSDPFMSKSDRREEQATEALRPIRAEVERTGDGTLVISFIKTYDDTVAAAEARRLLAKHLQSTPGFGPIQGCYSSRLPTWILNNFAGVVCDSGEPSESVALIGDYILKAGDALPRFPSVVVVDIRTGAAVLRYEGMEFELRL